MIPTFRFPSAPACLPVGRLCFSLSFGGMLNDRVSYSMSTKYLSVLVKKLPGLFYFALTLIFSEKAVAQQSAEEVAKKLANPVAGMISVPFQNNTDYGIGDAKGTRNTMNLQPVVPIKLSKKLNLITRYIIPIVTQ